MSEVTYDGPGPDLPSLCRMVIYRSPNGVDYAAVVCGAKMAADGKSSPIPGPLLQGPMYVHLFVFDPDTLPRHVGEPHGTVVHNVPYGDGPEAHAGRRGEWRWPARA